MIDLLFIEGGIWVLEENGKNVFLEDCLKFGISKMERRFLFEKLLLVSHCLLDGEELEFLIEQGYLKQLTRHPKSNRFELWEIRDPGRGGRIIIVLIEQDSIIISAVSKQKGLLNQAINRGINRWEKYLKKQKK